MLEKQVENRLIQELKKLDCECWKFTSPGRRGVPDRLVICPGRWVEFVEAKQPGGKPKPIQRFVHRLLLQFGFRVWIIDTYEDVDEFVKHLKNRTL